MLSMEECDCGVRAQKHTTRLRLRQASSDASVVKRRRDAEKLMELENQALKTAGDLAESARQAVDDLKRGRNPTDGDADNERAGASETLRNLSGTDAHALQAKRLLLRILHHGLKKTDEVKQTASLEMTQTCETVTQTTTGSLGKSR